MASHLERAHSTYKGLWIRSLCHTHTHAHAHERTHTHASSRSHIRARARHTHTPTHTHTHTRNTGITGDGLVEREERKRQTSMQKRRDGVSGHSDCAKEDG